MENLLRMGVLAQELFLPISHVRPHDDQLNGVASLHQQRTEENCSGEYIAWYPLQTYHQRAGYLQVIQVSQPRAPESLLAQRVLIHESVGGSEQRLVLDAPHHSGDHRDESWSRVSLLSYVPG